MSIQTTTRIRTWAQVAAAGALLGAWTGAGAALGIPNRPLFLANDVQANIFFALDDSGSMDFGTVVGGTTRNASFEIGALPIDPVANTTALQCGTNAGNDCYFWPSPVFRVAGFASYVVPGIAMLQRIAAAGPDLNDGNDTDHLHDYSDEAKGALRSVWRIWNHNYNSMWYNPTVTYIPWTGVDENGNAYGDASPTAALANPYDANGTSYNLTGNHPAYASTFWQGRTWDNGALTGPDEGYNDGYYRAMYTVWNDTDGDGELDMDLDGDNNFAECDFETDTTTATDTAGNSFCVPVPVEIKAANAPFTGGPNRTDCADAPSCTYEEEIQNFANWFQYYRTRELVLKRAVADLIESSSERMGMATINNNSGGTPIKDMTVEAYKNALMTELFEIRSNSGTGLRTLLNRVGHYFDQSDSGNTLHSGLGFSDASPILSADLGGECQQNFTLLFTDGFWNDSTPEDIDNADGDGDSAWDSSPHADTYENTLADYAMHYFERDLAPGLADLVPSGGDATRDQHLVTYTVAFGVPGTLSDADVPADHAEGTAPPPWPQPLSDRETTVDDLRHAAFNTRGLFLSASNPQDLIDSLSEVLADINIRLGVASAVAATSQSIQTGTLIFQGLFDTRNWDGKLYAKRIDDEGAICGELVEGDGGDLDTCADDDSYVWEASDLIPDAADRAIFSWDPASGTGVEFTEAGLGTDLVALIGSADIVDYIRGDRSKETSQEGGIYRTRDSLLGDIVDSTPVAVTKEQAPLPYDTLPGDEGDEYLEFLVSKQSRQDMVYVGANDGLLHGFATNGAQAGVEQFGYVPSTVLEHLADLADPNYTHRYYVDGGLTQGDAFIGGQWRTVLVGTPGRGGKSVFALDVSAPTTFNENDVLWEVTDGELGVITGAPAIARIGNGANAQWVAIFGNGYNSASETAKLYIVSLATGDVLDVIDTDNDIVDNGLATPLLVDVDGDFSVEYAYAGDLKGNLWKFDLSGDGASDWQLAEFANAVGEARPLYTALDTDGNPQAITSRPAFAFNPNGGYQILFGTGRLIASGDEIIGDPASVDTLYGINDRGVAIDAVGARELPGGNQPADVLQPQEVFFDDTVDTSIVGVEQGIGVVTQRTIDYASQYGWYLDLVLSDGVRRGERVISDTRVLGSAVLFTTFTPSEGCTSGNTSSFFGLDAVSGGRLNFSVFDINLDRQFGEGDEVDTGDGSEVVSRVAIPQTVAPVTLIASGSGDVVFGLVSGLQSGSTGAGGGEEGEAQVDDPNVYRLQPPRSTLGRQSWRQLR